MASLRVSNVGHILSPLQSGGGDGALFIVCLLFVYSLVCLFALGAPGDNPFRPVPTTYDYDAAISEAGDMTLKYEILRNTIGKVSVRLSVHTFTRVSVTVSVSRPVRFELEVSVSPQIL